MSELKKALHLYDSTFARLGYRKAESVERGPAYSDGGQKFIFFDRITGGDLRCLLRNGPSARDSREFDIEGESPWWRTSHDENVTTAVEAAIEFLNKSGFPFLDDPLRLVPTEWRELHGILVRDNRIRIINFSAPRGMEPNRAIMACIRCHPTLRSQPAVRVREAIGHNISIPSVRESLAFALEIKKKCESEGLIVTIAE